MNLSLVFIQSFFLFWERDERNIKQNKKLQAVKNKEKKDGSLFTTTHLYTEHFSPINRKKGF